MAAPKALPRFTIDQYLTLERHANERHEYIDGYILAMAGESLEHGIIAVNLVVTLGGQLKGKPCQVLTKDTKVRSGPTPPAAGRALSGLYSYPDVVVVCGDPFEFEKLKDRVEQVWKDGVRVV